jgi:hypothetical protein
MCYSSAVAYVWFCCPETTRRTLEELIGYLFALKKIRDIIDAEGIGRKGGMRRRSLEHSLNSSNADVIMTETLLEGKSDFKEELLLNL